MNEEQRVIDGFVFTRTDAPRAQDKDYIHRQIKAFNDAVSEHHRAIRPTGPKPLAILVRDAEGQLVGGLIEGLFRGASKWLKQRYLPVFVALRQP